MKKLIQLPKNVWLGVARVFAPVTRGAAACFAKVCGAGLATSGKSSEITRPAVAGMILFGIAGAGMGASGGISAYGVASSAAGATVAVGWGPYWLLWTFVFAATGAIVGAVTAHLARFWSRSHGAAAALLVIGALGGGFTGATWGSAVARERVVEVRAQPASAAPIAVGQGAKLSVVNGPVRLTGSVARDLNGLLLAFMLGSGALVGILAARGLSGPKPFDPATGQQFQQPSQPRGKHIA